MKTTVLVYIFFIILLCTGLSVFTDYGISWDEHSQRSIGIATIKYIFTGDLGSLELLTKDGYYGPLFEIFLVAVEIACNLTQNERSLFLMRHVVTFLFFYCAVIFLYRMSRKIFHSQIFGLLSCLFLVVSPRIFPHAFYNSKDIPFLSIYIIALYTLDMFLDQKTIRRAIIHAVICAIAIDIRIMGIILPAVTGLFVCFDIIFQKPKGRIRFFLSVITYFVSLFFFTILFWPRLWSDPIRLFLHTTNVFIKFPLMITIRYYGTIYSSFELPWHYFPVYFLITTPLLYSMCFIIGAGALLWQCIKHLHICYNHKRAELVALVSFFVPVIFIIGFRLPLYNGWRHLFFVYPAFIIISISGLIVIVRTAKRMVYKYGMIGVGICGLVVCIMTGYLLHTTYWMIQYHPYQDMYFNRLAGSDMKHVKARFDLDYWGISYKQALEYIVTHDASEKIVLAVASRPGKLNSLLLLPEQRNRLLFVQNIRDARYFLTHKNLFPSSKSHMKPYYSIQIDKAPIMVVFRRE